MMPWVSGLAAGFPLALDRKSTRLNSSHLGISYAVFCLKKKMISSAEAAEAAAGSFSFVQISDTHIGFTGQANGDPVATLQQVVDRVHSLEPEPAFVLHSGDQTHGQKAGAFDTVAEILKGVRTERILYVPGAHDVFLDG